MIFVTVGTHEQQFDRLIKCIDELKHQNVIQDDVVIQTGFSTYEPQYCDWSKLFSYEEMNQYVNNARIIITHGGPASFIAPLQIGKVPIVVPRRYEYGEHVNNHQVMFCNAVSDRMGTIIVANEIEELKQILVDYEKIVLKMSTTMNNNNTIFCENFEKIVDSLFG